MGLFLFGVDTNKSGVYLPQYDKGANFLGGYSFTLYRIHLDDTWVADSNLHFSDTSIKWQPINTHYIRLI